MPSIEIILSPAVIIPLIVNVLGVIVAIKMIPTIIQFVKEEITANKLKSADEAGNSYHEGCESEGYILHPEKTGDLKENGNPFEN